MVRLIGVVHCASEMFWAKRRLMVRLILLKKSSPDSPSRSVIVFKTEPFKPSDEKDSNVKVTGDPLWAACGVGMFVI